MKRCDGCKYWSERLAHSLGGAPVEAMCLCEKGPNYSRYVRLGCNHYAPGLPIDDPSLAYEDDD